MNMDEPHDCLPNGIGGYYQEALPLSPLSTPPPPPPDCLDPPPFKPDTCQHDDSSPRFAEDYSVFNTTPGNLRGSDFPFSDLYACNTSPSTADHRRLHSVDTIIAAESTPHQGRPSPIESHLSPVIDPSGQLSTPISARAPGTTKPSHCSSAKTSTRPTSRITKSKRGAKAPAKRKLLNKAKASLKFPLAVKSDMQAPHYYGQPDGFDAAALAPGFAVPTDNLYEDAPPPVPAPSPSRYWHASLMDPASSNFDVGCFEVQSSPPRPNASFDYGVDFYLFSDTDASSANVQSLAAQQDMLLRPQSASAMIGSDLSTDCLGLEDPFHSFNPTQGVDPGLLINRPQTAQAAPTDFNGFSTKSTLAVPRSNNSLAANMMRSHSARELNTGKLPARAHASSPIRPSNACLLPLVSKDGRKKQRLGRGFVPVAKTAPSRSSSRPSSRSMQRPDSLAVKKRSPPVLQQHGLSRCASLSLIAEKSSPSRARLQKRTEVRLEVDARGRARAVQTVVYQDGRGQGVGFGANDDEATDDEGFRMPASRASSSSVALADAGKCLDCVDYSGQRRMSRSSAGNSVSGAETMSESLVGQERNRHGDAESALLRVKQRRQKAMSMVDHGPWPSFGPSSGADVANGFISPRSLTGSNHGDLCSGFRCVCGHGAASQGGDVALQCDLCEMWLHGKCVGITQRSRPPVYVCNFCTEAAGRAKANGLGIDGVLLSPPLVSVSDRVSR
ncbi:hypothetical protein CDD81_6886 [Ophiocordyceps australis]|uniref:Zinc finger PHD-type domain-containing protein n=1 Tax=Ophiocordyceps australis TaxID=1399860 RepID=A0A2C5Y6S3_9HYPO|nr:hypothetical protein CDD81_6886 [Ophiocordyceps australis]